VNTIKTVFLAALLSAAAYGVYVGITGSPPNFGPRRKSRDWEETVAPDGGSESSTAGMQSAPMVSVEEHPAASSNSFSPPPMAATPPLAGATLPADSNSPSLPSAGQQLPPAPAELPADRYASNHTYPSMRPAPAHDQPPPGGSDSSRPPDRYADDGQRLLGGAQAEPSGGVAEHAGHDIHAEYAVMMQSVQSLLAQNQLAEALEVLSNMFGNPELTTEEDARLTDLVDRLAGTVVYSQQHLLEHPYEVQPGDTLDKIADAYEVPWQLLANINGIRDPRLVRPGDQLKVIRGPVGAHIDLSRFRLVLYVGNRYAGRFPIGIGEDHSTPEGTFEVQKKLTNPTYYGPTVIDKDDPSNPMGEYALHLGGDLWIHGTNDPTSIGKAGSRGCIRLSERDIKDLFEILTARTERTAGSKVVIRRDPLR
jgi:LysM repeat protein